MNKLLYIFSLILFISCSSDNRPEVIKGVMELYPLSGNTKVVSKSIIRSLIKQADSSSANIEFADQFNKIYYFSIDSSSYNFDKSIENVIDSVLSLEHYTLLAEMEQKGDSYTICAIEEKEVVKEIVIYKRSKKNITLVDVSGRIKIKDVLSNLNNLQKFTDNPMFSI